MTAGASGDGIAWSPRIVVDKYAAPDVLDLGAVLGREPTAADLSDHGAARLQRVSDGNVLTTAGASRILSLLAAAGGQGLTATSARIGVGVGSTAATAGDVDLAAAAGAANRWFQPLSGAPSVVGNTLTLAASFASGDGNFTWSEWGIDVSAPTVTGSAVVGSLLLNRRVAALGTKAPGTVWGVTVTLTLT